MPETTTQDTTLPQEPVEQYVAIGRLIATLAADPQYRPEVLRLIKQAAPNVPIPEVDLPREMGVAVQKTVKPLEEGLDEARKRLEALQAEWARRQWLDRHGLSEAEGKQIEELAKEYQIGNADKAVELWRLKMLQTRTTPPTPWEGITPEELREMAERPQQAARRRALRVLEQLRSERR